MIEYGDSVYVPAKRKRGSLRDDTRGPLGHWVRMEDPEYNEVFKEQSKLEEKWAQLREEAGDG